MRGLNSRSFLLQWRTLYGASNPGHIKDHWEVDGVDWTKERHAYWSEQYSVQFEVHRLKHRRGNKHEWELMVVIERWWGPDRRKGIRDTCWCRAITGKSDRILAWLKRQDPQPSSPAASPDEPAND